MMGMIIIFIFIHGILNGKYPGNTLYCHDKSLTPCVLNTSTVNCLILTPREFI